MAFHTSFALLIVLAAATPAAAQPRHERISYANQCDLDAHERIDFIQVHLDRAAGPMQTWWNTWLAIMGTLFVGQSVLAAITYDDDAWIDYATGAVGSLLGVGTLMIGWPSAATAADEVRETRPRTRAELYDKLRFAEDRLESIAGRERFGRGFLAHGGVVAYATAATLYLALDRDRLGGGLRIGIGALAVGEARIFTQPTEARAALRDYDAKYRPYLEAESTPSGCERAFGEERASRGGMQRTYAMRHADRGSRVSVAPFGLGLAVHVTF